MHITRAGVIITIAMWIPINTVIQITDEYFRQGRRNLDGYRMYYNPDMVSDLFDVSEVWDPSRPTPVPEM